MSVYFHVFNDEIQALKVNLNSCQRQKTILFRFLSQSLIHIYYVAIKLRAAFVKNAMAAFREVPFLLVRSLIVERSSLPAIKQHSTQRLALSSKTKSMQKTFTACNTQSVTTCCTIATYWSDFSTNQKP